MYNEQLESLIDAALADGVLTEKEKQVLFKRAQTFGIDLDEFEVVLDARLVKLKKEENAKAEASAPKSNNLGDVRRCPHCGAVIGSFQMNCPKCGFEFSNVGVNEYVKNFSQGLTNLQHTTNYGKPHGFMQLFDTGGYYEQQRRNQILESEEARFVKNYPLPMTKEDCIEALNFIAPKITILGSNAATYIWKKKYNAILQKLEREAKGNTQILDILKSYREQGRTNFFASFVIWYRSLSKIARMSFWGILFFVLFYGVGGALAYSWLNDSSDSKVDEVTEYVNAGDIKSAKKLIISGADPTPLYDYYMDNAMWEEAEDYIPHRYSYVSKEEYFNYCKKAVTSMCAAGKLNEAKKFIKRKVVYYEEYNSPESSYHTEWNTAVVSKKLNAIVDNY